MSLSRTAIESKVKEGLKPLRKHIDALLADGRSDEAMEEMFKALEGVLASQSTAAYGKKSEKLDPAQLALFLQMTADEDPDDEDEALDSLDDEEEAKEEPKKRSKHGRKRISENVERKQAIIQVPDEERTCPICGTERQVIGHECSETLEFIPAHFVVLENMREKMACTGCRESGVVVAPLPNKPFERSKAGASLITDILVKKYDDHLPLHRINKIYSRLGVELAVPTMSGWLERIAPIIEPIVMRLWALLLTCDIKQSDATGLKVLDRSVEDNIVLGTMWCNVGDGRIVVFKYAESGHAHLGPWDWFEGITGYLQRDGAQSFHRLSNGKVASAIAVGCWFHARRKFFPYADKDRDAAKALQFIQRLYKVEKDAKALGLDPDGVLEMRCRYSAPILKLFKTWLKRRKGRHPPKSDLGKAFGYLTRQWPTLEVFLQDGRIELDNSLCERQIRYIGTWGSWCYTL
jgi:transposase